MNDEMILHNLEKLKNALQRHNTPGSYLCIPLDDNHGCQLPVATLLKILSDAEQFEKSLKKNLTYPKT